MEWILKDMRGCLICVDLHSSEMHWVKCDCLEWRPSSTGPQLVIIYQFQSLALAFSFFVHCKWILLDFDASQVSNWSVHNYTQNCSLKWIGSSQISRRLHCVLQLELISSKTLHDIWSPFTWYVYYVTIENFSSMT